MTTHIRQDYVYPMLAIVGIVCITFLLLGDEPAIETTPTQITSCSDLEAIGSDPYNGKGLDDSYIITVNILECPNFTPIEGVFTGTLDGNGKSITNIKILNKKDKDKDLPTGIFRQIKSATIKNLTIYGGEIKANRNTNQGLLAGEASGSASDPNIISNVRIEGLKMTGDNGERTGSSGGLIGKGSNIIFDKIVMTLYSGHSMEMQQNYQAGGLMGTTAGNGPIIIKNVSVKYLNIISPECNGYATACAVGGLIGAVFDDLNIDETAVYAKLEGKSNDVGGFFGKIGAGHCIKIKDSYADIEVKGKANDYIAGGLIGSLDSTCSILQNTYTIMDVEGSTGTVYAVIGANGSNIEGGESFFDKSIVDESGDQISKGYTTAELQSPKQYPETDIQPENHYHTAWDRNIWIIESNKYPRLKNTP